ncbi:hypothetical protein HPB48_006853 [Haemaphysalis longicornis]|uniref:Nose resistant-to-fluoxetine protein N-terminal domain-containing protein n=1 Tax=Haemaphysalis longicornis TaxID=44386 RepID=A0A9J6FEE7_HAELO|nr:hypothetical protein HPB48_006853 [Haemaphysalis longicornis]
MHGLGPLYKTGGSLTAVSCCPILDTHLLPCVRSALLEGEERLFRQDLAPVQTASIATTTDIGAYDECIETVVKHKDGSENVRAQYCNLYIGSNGNYGAIEEVLPALAMTHKRDTVDKSYAGTFYHGVCFFSGCITFVLTQKFGRKARISAAS